MGTLPVQQHQQPYRDEHLALDFDQQSVILDSQRMVLTRKEYDLLALLVQHAGEIIPREALLMRVWGYGSEIRTRTRAVEIRQPVMTRQTPGERRQTVRMAAWEAHRLSLWVEDQIVARFLCLGDEIGVTFYVLRLDDEPEDTSLAGRDQIEDFLVVVSTYSHEETEALLLGSGVAGTR